jgi:APA family basic amino acid/polyamine antiporter
LPDGPSAGVLNDKGQGRFNGLLEPSQADRPTGGAEGHAPLAKTLSWPHLIGLGVGAIVGTGIYTLIGVGANLAGPGRDAVLRAGRDRVRLRGAGLRRAVDHDARGGQRLLYTYAVLGEALGWIVAGASSSNTR